MSDLTEGTSSAPPIYDRPVPVTAYTYPETSVHPAEVSARLGISRPWVEATPLPKAYSGATRPVAFVRQRGVACPSANSSSPSAGWEMKYRSAICLASCHTELFPCNMTGRDMEPQTRRMFSNAGKLVSQTDPEVGDYYVVDGAGTRVWITVFDFEGHRFVHPVSDDKEVASLVCPTPAVGFFAAALVRSGLPIDTISQILAIHSCVTGIFPTQSGGLSTGGAQAAARKRGSAPAAGKGDADGFKGAAVSYEGFELPGDGKPAAPKRKRAKKDHTTDGMHDTDDGEEEVVKKPAKRSRAKKAVDADLSAQLPDIDGSEDELAQLPDLPEDTAALLRDCGDAYDEVCPMEEDADLTDAVDSDGESYTKGGKGKGKARGGKKGKGAAAEVQPPEDLFLPADDGHPSEIPETPLKVARKLTFSTPPSEPSSAPSAPSAPSRPLKVKVTAAAAPAVDEVADFPDEPAPAPAKAPASKPAAASSTSKPAGKAAAGADPKPTKLPVNIAVKPAAAGKSAAAASKPKAKASEGGKGQPAADTLAAFSDGEVSDAGSPKKGKRPAAAEARAFAESAWD